MQGFCYRAHRRLTTAPCPGKVHRKIAPPGLEGWIDSDLGKQIGVALTGRELIGGGTAGPQRGAGRTSSGLANRVKIIVGGRS